jgi:signal transduction histidine kinase
VADRLQLALEAGHLGSYEFDSKTGSYSSTDQHKFNYGYKANEEFTLADLKKISVPDDRHLIEPGIAQQAKGQNTYSTEYRVRLGNDSIRWIKSVGRILRDEKNEPLKLVGISIDITELKLFTEELSKQVNERTLELQRSNEDLIQFAHVASHDLKEPVRKIRTFAGRLLDEFGPSLPEKGNLYLEKIQKATTRMFSMIEGVLNYSMHGILEESFTLVDLNKIIRQIESDLDLLISQKNASIVKSELPIIRGNAILIHQLFYNLINNSLKFSKSDTPLVITISSSRMVRDGRNYVKIELTDNGIGFENEFALKIFDTFTRLHPKDQYEGTGLGLALCKKIVDRHHGFISAHGELDQGAVFTILLPT